MNAADERMQAGDERDWLPRSAVAGAINPHLLTLLKIEARHPLMRVPATALLSPGRLDVMAKYGYAVQRVLGTRAEWGTHVYREHLRVWNQFREGDGSGKQSFDDYLRAYDRLLESMAGKGFDEAAGVLPVDCDNAVIDGSHRLAAALAAGAAVTAARFDMRGTRYDQEYFRRLGLAPEVLDDMALAYCLLDARVRVAVLFPVARGRDEEVLELLGGRGAVVYRKAVTFSLEGRANLVRLLYRNEPWLGEGPRPSAGLLHHVNNRFAGHEPVQFIFFAGGDAAADREAKGRIRDLFGLANDSIHVNDTHEQTVAIAQAVLNANSVHFLNHARPASLPNFTRLFARYREWIARERLDARRLCVDGSAVLAAYGLRDIADLDFLHAGAPVPAAPDPLISPHNEEAAHHHAAGVTDLVMDPRNHFYLDGVKLVALHRMREMKARRAEPKDAADVYRIDALEGRVGWAGRALEWYYTLPERLYNLRYRAFLAVKRAIPAPLLPAARAVYRWPQVARGWFGPERQTMVYRGFELHYSRGTSLIEGIRGGRLYEPEITRNITPALQGGGLFLDIGANIGLITLNVLADAPAARIVAFEPGAHQSGLLAATVAANRLEDRVTVHRCALADREGTAQFAIHRSRHASGDGFLDTHRAGRTQTVEVPMTTLDRWWSDAGRPRVQAMKIDTEGAELWVLKGGEALLAACRPLVVFELNARNLSVYPHEAVDVLRFFTQRGYAVRSVDGAAITEANLARHVEAGNDYVAEPRS